MSEYINVKKFSPWFVVKEDSGLFMVADWGMCDTIEHIEWTMDRLYATEFTNDEKIDLDNRYKDTGKNFAQAHEAEWIQYEKFVETKFVKKVENVKKEI